LYEEYTASGVVMKVLLGKGHAGWLRRYAVRFGDAVQPDASLRGDDPEFIDSADFADGAEFAKGAEFADGADRDTG
jgi:hypothetical protein